MDNTFDLKLMNNDPNRYKYSEDSILKELTDYISGYNQHYSVELIRFKHLILLM